MGIRSRETSAASTASPVITRRRYAGPGAGPGSTRRVRAKRRGGLSKEDGERRPERLEEDGTARCPGRQVKKVKDQATSWAQCCCRLSDMQAEADNEICQE